MKFTRTGWNNVLIFSAMAIILIANISTKHLFPENLSHTKTQNIAILGDKATILTLTINQTLSIERVGKHWRSNHHKLQNQLLSQTMMSWQQLVGDIPTQTPVINNISPIHVVVELANNDTAKTLALYLTNQQLFIIDQQLNKWYVVPSALFTQLIPIKLT